MNEISDKLRAFEVGAVDYITKPFQAEEVLARVQTQTDLSNTRKALEQSNTQLRAMMEQMVQSEKLKSLGFLAAGVAHELNTPIGNAFLVADTMQTMARNYIQAQATGAPTPSMEDLVATCTEGAPFILSNLQRASTLIQSLKEVSVDQASERRRSVQLLSVVSDIVALLGTRFKKTPYSVSIDIAPEISLDTYPGHLDQILENLVQNAIVHGFEGAPSGAIHLSATQAPGDRIALVVSDNGKGIAPEHLRKVFDPFFTTKLGQGGSGLGLHIAYTTGVLGGSISVASTLGAGAQFTLLLPRVAPDAGNL
jgi:signal transduction histidine kinase